MQIKVEEIPEEGLDFIAEKGPDAFRIDSDDCRLQDKVKVSGFLEKSAGEVYWRGRVETELSVSCSRCLEPFAFPVSSKFQAHFVPASDEEDAPSEKEIQAADIDVEPYEGDRIDLTQVVHGQILLALPAVSVCREDCQGLCSECGANLNQGPCGCDGNDSVDPRLAVLKKIKEQIK